MFAEVLTLFQGGKDAFVHISALQRSGGAWNVVGDPTEGALITLALKGGLDATTDKLQTLTLARRVGVPVPRTHRVESASGACKRAEDLAWPVVLKPQRSVRFRRRGDRLEVGGAGATVGAVNRSFRRARFAVIVIIEDASGDGRARGARRIREEPARIMPPLVPILAHAGRGAGVGQDLFDALLRRIAIINFEPITT